MTGWMDYASVVVAAVGLVQVVFLCLVLRSEGARAFAANRWMMLFIAAIALNLVEDVLEQFVAADLRGVLDLIFGPMNFAIAPAIYLYFREISGNPCGRAWGHFILPLVVFNLLAWVVTHDGGRSVLWVDGYQVRDLVGGFCWGGIFVQACIYMALVWRVASRYLRKTEEQLGADRKAMQRWVGVILGCLTFMFMTLAVSKIVGLYQNDSGEMFGTEIAFALILFAMSYEIATQPALFVMADWPFDDDVAQTSGAMSDASSASDDGKNDTNGQVTAANGGSIRPLLDEDGVTRALSQLNDIEARGDILFDPLVSLPKLARAVGVTPNQLSYVLNHHVGKSFFDFVNAARVAEARSVLVLEPERTILDIALSVGFNSKSTFNLAFKKITGETPSAVREAARQATTGQDQPSEIPITRPDQQYRTPKAG